MKKTAIIVGASGLVGGQLLRLLEHENRYELVKSIIRRPQKLTSNKIQEIVVDFEDTQALEEALKGNDLFICIGTTIKKAGSVSNMEKIDRDLPVLLAKYAAKNGVETMVAISSIGANMNSNMYYARIKGEMEMGVLKYPFACKSVVRPSMLLGKRSEFRWKEVWSEKILKVISPLLIGKLRKYRGIKARNVAKAMLVIANTSPCKVAYESDELEALAAKY